jgi:hypothetical protein
MGSYATIAQRNVIKADLNAMRVFNVAPRRKPDAQEISHIFQPLSHD